MFGASGSIHAYLEDTSVNKQKVSYSHRTWSRKISCRHDTVIRRRLGKQSGNIPRRATGTEMFDDDGQSTRSYEG